MLMTANPVPESREPDRSTFCEVFVESYRDAEKIWGTYAPYRSHE